MYLEEGSNSLLVPMLGIHRCYDTIVKSIYYSFHELLELYENSVCKKSRYYYSLGSRILFARVDIFY
jgi:hypothetical protein